MNTYIISSTIMPSKVPFRIKASSEDEALETVSEHMGMTSYKVIGVEEE